VSKPPGRTIRVALVAGEASGDLLGAHLLQALSERVPRLEAFGIGGPKMQSAGLDAWYPMETLAVRGYVEVLRSLPKLLRIRRDLRRRLLADPPDLFIGVDAPDFNLGLELVLRSRGITTVHYASPSIWAWRGERIHKIKRAVSKMLALFPFEPAIYEKAGVPVAYVGHPLADELPEYPDKDAAREQMKLPQEQTVVALLPGSRQSEVRQMGELFAATARLVAEQVPDVHFLVPLVSRETRMIFEEALYHQGAEHLPVTILFGHAHMAMVAADAVLVASGTATLEAALLKRPMVNHIQDAATVRVDHAKARAPALCGAAEHPCRRICGSGNTPGGRHPGESGAGAGKPAAGQGSTPAAGTPVPGDSPNAQAGNRGACGRGNSTAAGCHKAAG
jgi:lipid-A-disaccharide synthase